MEANPDSTKAKIGMGQMLSSEGNLYVELKKYNEAIGIFSQAAEVAAYPALPYFNLCATLYNIKHERDAWWPATRRLPLIPRWPMLLHQSLHLVRPGKSWSKKNMPFLPGRAKPWVNTLSMRPSGGMRRTCGYAGQIGHPDGNRR